MLRQTKRDLEGNAEHSKELGRALCLKLTFAFGLVVLASLISVLPEYLHTRENMTKAGAAKVLRSVVVLGPAEELKSDIVRRRLCSSKFCENGKDGVALVVLTSGKMPEQTVKAIVETDRDCAPDKNGISHCNNRLRLADGRLLDVRYDHSMKVSPCLTPGETIVLKPQNRVRKPLG